MAFRIRPATTIAVILAISLAFQLIAILTVPVTSSLTLCTYDDVQFGVFGICSQGSCSKAGIGYSAEDVEDLTGFSLPSNARHSISKLLIVHPIAGGFTFILLVLVILLHWHAPANSLKLLFTTLLWTMPTFLLCLLAFLVDILLFIPHLDWTGWLVLAAAILIAISSILLCIMRRTVSSRRGMKNNKLNSNGADYQLAPLNYGYGTVDGGSDTKLSGKDEDADSDERAPFVHDETENYDETLQHTRNYEDLNNYPQTELFDTMDTAGSRHKSSPYRNSNILAPLSTAYRGYEYTPPITEAQQPLEQTPVMTQEGAPYPSEMPISDPLGTEPETTTAPYPQDDLIPTHRARFISTPSTLMGPRPMPGPHVGSDKTPQVGGQPIIGPGYPIGNDELINQAETDEFSAPPLPNETPEIPDTDPNGEQDSIISDPTVERQPTYRTKIEQTLNGLQPYTQSSDSFVNTNDNLLENNENTGRRDIGPIQYETDEDFETTNDDSFDVNQERSAITTQNDNDDVDELYQPTQVSRKPQPINFDLQNLSDDASSMYSSQPPSVIPTPVETSFRRQPSILQSSRIPEGEVLSSQQFQAIGDRDNLPTPSESSVTLDDYPFPDPNERRVTPAPSFSNESIGSSTFTSVSQRGINPRYLERNPEEQREYLQREINQHLRVPGMNVNSSGIHTTQRTLQAKTSAADLLIASNPDFSVAPKINSKKKNRG